MKTIIVSFLDVLIDINNINFTTSTYKKNPLIRTPVQSTLKVNAVSDIKMQYPLLQNNILHRNKKI